jgi:Rrf2 family protein
MRLSTRSTYSLRALLELALAQGRGPVSAAIIAKRQALSVAYLEQLLHRLKRQGLVHSTRGPKGGYVLARTPEEITVADVVRGLEAGNGHRNGHGANGAGSKHAQRMAEVVQHCVQERLVRSLEGVSLEALRDAVQTGDEEASLDHRYVFHI